MVFGLYRIQTYQLAVFVFFLVLRLSYQKISIQSTQSKNEIDFYASQYLDTAFCRTIPGLTKSQIELCNQQPDTTMIALDGLNQAVNECQAQFDGYRWNCSSLSTRGKNPYISAILQRGYKETSFSNAISSAGVVIAVARACSSSALQNCGCDEKIYKIRKTNRQMRKEKSSRRNAPFSENYYQNKEASSYSKESSAYIESIQNSIPNQQLVFPKEGLEQPISWKWGGCSHNLKFGMRFSKMFLDSREKGADIHSKTNLHNNQVGRMIVKQNMKVVCKCHGISGSCQIKTCWRSTPDLKVVAEILKDKFKSAILVDQSNLGGKNLRKFNVANPKAANHKPLRTSKVWIQKKNKKKRDLSLDLLFYEKSPNFCDKNSSLDILGTSGRVCNSTIKIGTGSCSSLCCGRGYNLVKHTKMETCRCKFIWCCKVECDVCNTTNWISVCK